MENISKTRTCKKCNRGFELTDADFAYYGEISVPPPTLCPDCRQRRRLAWRNERVLYHRTCSGTGKKILSVYSEDKPFPVYDPEYWYSDAWDPRRYARDFDFSRSFFEQFRQLMHAVPQLARSVVNNQNCDFVNQSGWGKNCYLIFDADYNENCLYANNLYDSRTSMDILHGTNGELCYECINCVDCYNLKYSQNCQSSSDSWFLKNCVACKNCFGCVNLRNKQYYFFNEQCTKESYEEKIRMLELKTRKGIAAAQERFLEFTKKFPNKAMFGTRNENSTGDYMWNTQNCHYCFDVNNAQDCKFIFSARNIKKVYDMTVFGATGGTEFCYENHEIGDSVRNLIACDQIWTNVNDVSYSKLCMMGCHDLFGCVGLRHAEYSILNKQYTKEEYVDLKTRIIEHMKQTGEWGEFFPEELSPFAYNETLAQYYFPLTKEEALAQNLKWKDRDAREYQSQTYRLPETIAETPETIINEVLGCTLCGKNFKIVAQELQFYKQQNLPPPEKCPDCRHMRRMRMRNPRVLYKRACMKCQAQIETTYAPEGTDIVYCENCYQESTD